MNKRNGVTGNADVAALYSTSVIYGGAAEAVDAWRATLGKATLPRHRYEGLLTPIPSFRIVDRKRVPIRYRIVVEAIDHASALEAINVIQAHYWPGIVLQGKIVQRVTIPAMEASPFRVGKAGA